MSMGNSQQDLLAILKVISENNNQISPEFSRSFSQGYQYCLLDKYCAEYNVEEQLNYLSQFGCLKKTEVDVAHPCHKCSSIAVNYRDACENCESVHIYDEHIIHHFACSYQAKQSDFEDALGNYYCPKCNMIMNQIGLDYDKPGIINICRECQHESQQTIVMGKCLNCNNNFNIENSPRQSIYSYHMTALGIEAVIKNELQYLDPKKMLEKEYKIIDSAVFFYLLDKFKKIHHRYQLSSTLLTISINNTATELSESGKIDLLLQTGKAIKELVRETDVVSYYNQSLCILFPHTNSSDIDKAVVRHRNKIKEIAREVEAENIFISIDEVKDNREKN